jgi:hypothetical protein
LKFKFRFWVIPSLDVRASDASDHLMVGYLLELLCEGAPAEQLIDGVPIGISPYLRVVIG